MTNISLWLGRSLFLISISIFSASATADYPSPQDDYLNDFAGVIQPTDRDILRKKLEALENQSGIEGTVVTINSVADYPTGDANLDEFATRLLITGVWDTKQRTTAS